MINFQALRDMRAKAFQDISKQTYLQIINALRDKPGIKINDTRIIEVDAWNSWPSTVGSYTGINNLLYYKDVPLSLSIDAGMRDVKLSFPELAHRKFVIRTQYEAYYAPEFGSYYSKRLRDKEVIEAFTVSCFQNTDDLYALLEPAYKKYQSILSLSKRTDAEWETIRQTKLKAIEAYNTKEKAASMAKKGE